MMIQRRSPLRAVAPVLIALAAASLPRPAGAAEDWVPLFDGKTLEGWSTEMPALWVIERGAIVGRSAGIDHNEFLYTKKKHGDFDLRYEVRLVNDVGNSGVQLRSARADDGHAVGYQVDVGKGYWGSLYHEAGRGMLALYKREDGGPGDPVKTNEFNKFEITARGHHISVKVNGVTTVDLEVPEGELDGLIALQVHAGGPMEVQFRNIEIREAPGK